MKAIKRTYLKGVLIVVCTLICFHMSWAQTYNFKSTEYSVKHTGQQIYDHTLPDTMVVVCDQFSYITANPSTWQSAFKFKSLNAFVKFQIDEQYSKQQRDYVYQLAYKIYGYKDPADTISVYDLIYDTLTISNNKYDDPNNAYQSISLDKYSNYYKIIVVATEIYDLTSGTPVVADTSDSMRKNFFVESSILSQRYDFENSGIRYYGVGTSLGSNHEYFPSNNLLKIYFNFSPIDTSAIQFTPSNYELEWTYVDDYRYNLVSGTDSIESDLTTLRYDFINNSTRVTLNTNRFSIPILYNHGYIIYRVRMVRPDSLLYKFPIYGDWSSNIPDRSTIDSANYAIMITATGSQGVFQIPNSFSNDSINWNYTASFAEGGKYKHIVNYYDGLLKNRQTITKLNSEPNYIVVTKKVYDNAGNPAITIMPTPVPINSLNYLHNFDINALTLAPYKASDFDSFSVACPNYPELNPLHNTAWANRYYSPYNSDTFGVQRYVPNAEGYPFSQTIFSLEKQGSFDVQGGFGPKLQLHNSNVQSNYFVNVNQSKINRYFGINGGYSQYYSAVVSRDPNHQLSSVITDYEGKTVMSSLIGRGPNPDDHAIVPINAPDASFHTSDLIGSSIQIIEDTVKSLDYSFFNEVEGNVTFQYGCKIPPFPVCGRLLSTKFTYEYSVINQCGDTVLVEDSTVGSNGFVTGTIDFLATLHTEYLGLSKFDVNKRLSVSPIDIRASIDSVLAFNSCYKDEPYFIRKNVEACKFPCPSTYLDPCAQRKQMLKEQLHPRAKYGTYTFIGDSIVANDTASIFSRVRDTAITGTQNYIRYLDTCTQFSLPDSMLIADSMCHNIRTMPPIAFLALYNWSISVDATDPIAEALLPLHPEYCLLANCFSDTFKVQLEAIPNARIAASRNLLLLDSIIAHDPALTYLTHFGYTYADARDSLMHYRGGLFKIDSFAFMLAYCGCGDSIMDRECVGRRYNYEINHKILINDFVKEKYFQQVMPIYLANRDRLLDDIIYGMGRNCARCAGARMKLIPEPVFGHSRTDSGYYFPSYTDSAWSGTAHGPWLLSVFSSISAGSAISDSFLRAMADSAAMMYTTADSMMCFGQIDTIMSRLSNCGSGNASILAGIRNTLDSFCTARIVHHGAYSPEMIRFAITRNGASINDFCNPYLISFGLPLPSLSEGFNCKSDSFYSAIGHFFRDTAVIAALRNPGSMHRHILNSANNEVEFQMQTILTTASSAMDAQWIAADSMYLLSVYVDPSFGTGLDTVKYYLRGTGGCGHVFALGDSVGIMAISCVNTLTIPPAIGYINKFSFVADIGVYDTASSLINLCSLLGWNDTIKTLNDASNTIADCVPCTELKKHYKVIRDTMRVFGIRGVDHPMYGRIITNYLNNKLLNLFDESQYETFIHSCALADSIKMPKYVGYANLQFSSFSDADSFVRFLNSIDTNYTFPSFELDSVASTHTVNVSVKLNDVPYELLWKYADTIRAYGCPYNKKVVDTGLEYLYKGQPCTGTSSAITLDVSLGTVLSDTVLPSSIDIFGSGGPSLILDSCWKRMGTSLVKFNYYHVRYSDTSVGSYQISKDVYNLTKYLSSRVAYNEFTNFYDGAVNCSDYQKIQKVELLRYTYGLDSLPSYAVLDSLQADNLRRRVLGYNNIEVAYQTYFDPNNVTNLYLSDSSTTNSRYLKLLTMLRTVKDSNGVSGQMCFTNNVKRIKADSSMFVFHCSDGSYWIRYFGVGDTLWNVYYKIPEWINHTQDTAYRLYAVTPFYVKKTLGDANAKFFKMKLVHASGSDTIEVNGMTSFTIGSGMMLSDVLLGNSLMGGGVYYEPDTFDNCERQILEGATLRGIHEYAVYIDSVKRQIATDFRYWMFDSVKEHLYTSSADQSFGITLYKYDKAGNLSHTIPPAGIDTLTAAECAMVDTLRNRDSFSTALLPNYSKVSSYYYNTLNQVVEQNTPDAGTTSFYYDAIGRLIFSRNAKQTNGTYTYNLYDNLSRLIEAGEVTLTDTSIVGNVASLPHETIIDRVHDYTRRDVIVTVYDTPVVNLGVIAGQDPQENLLHRVAAVKYFETLTFNDSFQLNYTHCTHYNYDISGNVKTLVQDFPPLASIHQQFKRIDYDFDLISGKVNMLSYNRGYPDQYYQKYDYDADNRITQVQTSGDGLVWKRDASYIYYKHGPLARIELGDLRVQGVDFAYTLQGWLKLVNSDTLNPTLDMGRDGDSTIMAPDAVAMNIDYFRDDYKPITSYVAAHSDPLIKELFNGNIARQTSDNKMDYWVTNTTRAKLKRLSKQYIYDQLNRIHNAHYSYIDSANMLTATPEFKSTYAYDPDGNILSLTRNGSVKVGSPPGASILMDSLTYTYGNGYGGYSLNQLKCLNEDAPDLYANDIKYQHACDTAPPNYVYDPIGNTTMDLVSGQSDIKWNIYNKVVETINATDSVIMRFKYDGAGNRIAKYFMQRTGTDTNCKSDYYVRDAQGNILATYRDDFQYDGGGALLSRKYHLAGHDIYGSSRLGVKNYWPSQHRWLWDNTMSEYDSLTINQRQPWYSLEYQDIVQKDSLDVYGSTHTGIWKSIGITGQKQYEITDHLGNVLSTVSDARGSNAPHTSTDSFTITGYEPAIKSITDYYPFGMQMPDRCYSDGTTHTTNISAVTTVPVHHMVNRVWPDGRAVSILGASILPGPSPLALIASGAESLSYQLPRYIDGLMHTVRIFTHGVVPPGFRAEISIGGTGPTAFSGISTDLTYLSSSAFVPYLYIYNLGMRDTIFIDSVHIDSATYEPYHVLSSISSSDGYAYGFNGHMKDNEFAGVGNYYDFGGNGLNVRICRRFNIEPYIKKYPAFSSYLGFGNNPIINLDPDGNDKVYFNADGSEAYREKSNSEFRTFIMANFKAGNPKVNLSNWVEVAMPKIIETRIQTGETTSGPEYQKYDYVIAARVGYFNQAKNGGILDLYTEGGNAISQDAIMAIPDLDPTLVKSVALQESHLGFTGINDIMQSNVAGDWKGGEMKLKYSLVKDIEPIVTNSLYAGIRILATKGFRGGISYNKKSGTSSYTFQGWDNAVKNYNGSGNKETYKSNVITQQNEAANPKCSNYTDECK